MVLEPLNKNAPGMPSVLYELARVKYLCGEQGGRGGVKGQRTKVKKKMGERNYGSSYNGFQLH